MQDAQLFSWEEVMVTGELLTVQAVLTPVSLGWEAGSLLSSVSHLLVEVTCACLQRGWGLWRDGREVG